MARGQEFLFEMVQKMEKRRGRPRAYDPEQALAQATAIFWDAGYAATSLDELSAGMGMNRPSLYGAFGDKRALYRRALERYKAMVAAGMRDALGSGHALPEGLRRVYGRALALFLSGERGPRGCFLIGTALTEAVTDPGARVTLADGLRTFDALFEERFRCARSEGELAADADPAALAKIASAALQSLAIRARAGESRSALEATAEAAIAVICRKG